MINGVTPCLKNLAGTLNMSVRNWRCVNKVVLLNFSSLCQRQPNSLAEMVIDTCKSLLTKEQESKECPYAALCMNQTTPLDDHMPSPYKLLFWCKPQTMLPSTTNVLKSRHSHDDNHKEGNQQHQAKQTEFYDKKASGDKRTLRNKEPVFVQNTLKGTWEPVVALNRPKPVQQPRTY